MVEWAMRCLLCEQSLEAKGDQGAPQAGRCGNCGSKARHRELAWFFERYLAQRLIVGTKVLEVGPSMAQIPHFSRPRFLGEARYTAIDTRPRHHHLELKSPNRFLEMDVTRLTFSDQSFDVIVANNVFPFIRSDFQAMAQVHRCLKAQGLAVLCVSHPLPKTRRSSEMAAENPELYTEELRAEIGTEWIYGEDYFERLEAAGFFHHRFLVESAASSQLIIEQAMRPAGELILCFKFRDTMENFLEIL